MDSQPLAAAPPPREELLRASSLTATTSIILDSSCALLSCPESESSSEPDGGLGELVLEVGVLGLERRDPLLCLKR